jgi:hypothetical protein
MTTEETGVVVGWSAVWTTAVVSVGQGLVLYGFFAHQRRREIRTNRYDLYEPRQNTRRHRSPAPFARRWWKEALEVSDEETLHCVGLDAYMWLRLFRLGARITALGTFLSCILIPIYATGKARGASTEKFNQLTLARVEQGSQRMWASLICWLLFVAFILLEFYREWKLFAVNRYAFLAHGDADMPRDFRYAVRCEQVPPKYRTDDALKSYFQRLFPNKVREATIYLQLHDLHKLIMERDQAIRKVEAAVAFTKAKPEKPRPMCKINAKMGYCGGEKVDVIDHYLDEIERLNGEIDSERAKFLTGPPYADMEQAVGTNTAVAAKSNDDEPCFVTLEETAATDDDDDVDGEMKAGESTKAMSGGRFSLPRFTFITREQENPNATSTAFVTFTSLRAKQAAVQCELTGNPDSMVVFPAPDPKGILWGNMSVPYSRQQVLQIQAAIIFAIGILFWTVPVSFVTSIANLNSILKAFGVKTADPHSGWYGLVSGLLPVIALAILMAVLYTAIVGVATNLVRYKSMPEVDAYALHWHQLFQFANLWLILIGGSVFNQIHALISDPTKIVEIIARAMPGASIFFVNMILARSFGQFGMELSMVSTYGIKLIMKAIQPEALQTQRQIDEGKKPPSIVWGQNVPPMVFIFLVSIIYMPIVPIMEVFALAYFAGSYIVWKHQCLHVYTQDFEGGGEATWLRLFGFLMACLYTGEAVFIAYSTSSRGTVLGSIRGKSVVLALREISRVLCFLFCSGHQGGTGAGRYRFRSTGVSFSR